MYNADIYLRISKEDAESDSIGNQRALLLNFAESMPDIRIHKIRVDDGFSGIDFNRPAFRDMITDIAAGIVNCVIVKDFSRFGRNYIEAGRYIQILFPQAGVRFIAVNDGYDSARQQGFADDILVSFKNMVNDAYSADISTKVRSHLEIKRAKGDFVGAFATYGYMKDPANHNRLVPDSFAADVVRDIFLWKLDGMSAQGIADKLNESGILSPLDYKRFMGLRYSTAFKLNPTAKWQARAVSRILENAVYIGVLEQGKRVTPNYKLRLRLSMPKEQWIRVENTHEPIIGRELFFTVQDLLRQDTRAAAQGEPVRPLSGIIFCAGCGAAMVHKTNIVRGKRYGYYVCSGHRANKMLCSMHCISANMCETAVLAILKIHAASMLDLNKITGPVCRHGHKLQTRLAAKQEELRRCKEYRLSLHESYRDGIIPSEDFTDFSAVYDARISEAERVSRTLMQEIETATETRNCEAVLKAFLHADKLARRVAVEFVKKVSVHENGRIGIEVRYKK